MFYIGYLDYMSWYNWYYNITPESVEEPTEPEQEKKEVEVNPHTFPSANFTQPEPMINIAQLETEQENVYKDFLIYPKRNRRQRR